MDASHEVGSKKLLESQGPGSYDCILGGGGTKILPETSVLRRKPMA